MIFINIHRLNIPARIVALLAALPLLCCCMDEMEQMTSSLSEGEGWLFVEFDAARSVQVQTRSTQSYASENAVNNMYVFIFDSNGNKLYGKWLTTTERRESRTEVENSLFDAWYAANSSTEDTQTTGCLKIKASAGTNLELFVITNLDSDMVRISSDLLAHNVSKKSDLESFTLVLNQETVSRNTNFPMTGSISSVTIVPATENKINTDSDPLLLTRLDAKVRFVFKTGNRPDENNQRITSFKAKQWKVINVPATSYVIPHPEDSHSVNPLTASESDYADLAQYFFDTPWRNFEDETTTTQEFSFYMLENRQKPKNTSFTRYQDRSRQEKTASGQNRSVSVDYTTLLGKPESKDIKVFANANDFSTYVLVTGRVDMDLVNDEKGQTLGADVQYLIHLGDWTFTEGSSWDEDKSTGDKYTGVTNFETLRNHSYTYTVTVNSVNNIRVEVEGGDENQPGATGEVIIAKEEIALCDAHYVSKTLSFHAKNFYTKGDDGTLTSTADRLTWKVRTPFSDGAPDIKDGVTIASHLDYQWVHFRLNKKKDDTGQYYSDKRRKYTTRVFEHKEISQDNLEDDGTEGLSGKHNDGCMDIIALVRYIKDQTKLFVDYRNEINQAVSQGLDTLSIVNKSDFDTGLDDMDGPKISVTVFVDEYFYDEHPINHQSSSTLWKSFVNKPDRTMHILCDSNSSADLESTSTGSVITIQQKSIQTIYNDDPSYTVLETAWGLEHEDEFPEMWLWRNTENKKNESRSNGLLNTMRLWDLCPTDGTTFTDDQPWGNYVDIEVENEVAQLKDAYKSLRYSCMTRNRDNNGDGKIGRDEIRWYTASINQLIGLYMAEGVITPSSRLYNRSAEEKESSESSEWMQHVISSTHFNAGYYNTPLIVWAEEGISTGNYTGGQQEGAKAEMSVRCVRNLGMEREHDLDLVPEDYITRDYVDDHTVFTCTHINEASLRDYTSVELPIHAENSRENYLYKKFEVADEFVESTSCKFVAFNDAVTAAVSNGQQNPYCPQGYRTPNQRELAIMVFYKLLDSGGNDVAVANQNIMTRTYWSFGIYAGTDKKNDKTGFLYYSSNVTLADQAAKTTRCVRDIRAN